MKITGTVKYIDIGTGCWGIVDDRGRQYRPINFPKNLEKEGLKARVTAKKVEEEFSVFMWGEAVEIVSYEK